MASAIVIRHLSQSQCRPCKSKSCTGCLCFALPLGNSPKHQVFTVSKMNCRKSSSFCVVVVADGKHCVLCVTTLSQIKVLETWKTMSRKHSILTKLVWLGCRRWRNPVFDWISSRCRTFVRLVPWQSCHVTDNDNRFPLVLFPAQISNTEDVFAPAVSKEAQNETITVTSLISLTNKLHLSYSWASECRRVWDHVIVSYMGAGTQTINLITFFRVHGSGLTIWSLSLNQLNQIDKKKKGAHRNAPAVSRASLSVKCVIDVISCNLPSLWLCDDLACS